jgi:CDP-paratose 2-epimerase
VTSSLADPIADFEVNARGTLNVLEAVRRLDAAVPLLFTSTGNIYGDLADVPLATCDTRYGVPAYAAEIAGINEQRRLDFRSPFGCSKGAAEQYVLDYARTFDLPATVFRLSCSYGPHQCGDEDHGWIAHFLGCALQRRPITIYGDGRQVCDALFADDLVDAMIFAQANIDAVRGRAFNVGGGPANTISRVELIALIRTLHGEEPAVTFADERVTDQKFYISDISQFCAATGWRPRVRIREGVKRFYRWLVEHRPAGGAMEPTESDRTNVAGIDVEFAKAS